MKMIDLRVKFHSGLFLSIVQLTGIWNSHIEADFHNSF